MSGFRGAWSARWCQRVFALALAWLAVPSVAAAVVCDVPAAYPTVQAAVNDSNCTEIVLAAQSFSETVTIARSLTLRGAGSSATTLSGSVSIAGPGVAVDLRQLTVDATGSGAAQALSIAIEAEVAARDLVTRNGDGVTPSIFTDGFESGDTSAWSSAVP